MSGPRLIAGDAAQDYITQCLRVLDRDYSAREHDCIVGAVAMAKRLRLILPSEADGYLTRAAATRQRCENSQ